MTARTRPSRCLSGAHGGALVRVLLAWLGGRHGGALARVLLALARVLHGGAGAMLGALQMAALLFNWLVVETSQLEAAAAPLFRHPRATHT